MPALTSSTGAPAFGNYQGHMFITLLPYIEQKALFTAAMAVPTDTWDGNEGTGVCQPPLPSGQWVRIQPMKPYQCPSDFTLTNGWAEDQVGGWKGASCFPNQQLSGTVRAGVNCDAPQFNSCWRRPPYSATWTLGRGRRIPPRRSPLTPLISLWRNTTVAW